MKTGARGFHQGQGTNGFHKTGRIHYRNQVWAVSESRHVGLQDT